MIFGLYFLFKVILLFPLASACNIGVGIPHKSVKEHPVNAAALKISGNIGWIPDDSSISNLIIEFEPPLILGEDYDIKVSPFRIPDQFLTKTKHSTLTLVLRKGKKWIKNSFEGSLPFYLVNIHCKSSPSTLKEKVQIATIINKKINCPHLKFPDSTPAFTNFITEVLHDCHNPRIIKSRFLLTKHISSVALLDMEPPVMLVDGSDHSRMDAADIVDSFVARHSVLEIAWEPMNDEDPQWWVLIPKPKGLPGHVFAILDVLQWEHPAVIESEQYKRTNSNCTRTSPGCIPGCPGTSVQTIAPSGYTAAAHFLLQGFQKSIHEIVPLQLAPISLPPRDTPPLWTGKEGWMYTYGGCSSNFMDCYFLDHSPCPRITFDLEDRGVSGFNPKRHNPRYGHESMFNYEPKWWRGLVGHETATIPESTILGFQYQYTHSGHLLYSFLFRPKYSFRLTLHDSIKEFEKKHGVLGSVGNECAVMHVRRGDILLHGGQSRMYLSVVNYVQGAKPFLDALGINTIFLMTDSQGAVNEALRCETEYPEVCKGIRWKFLDKKRWVAGEGGWENPFPTGSAVDEMRYIHLEFALAQGCDFTIFGESGYSERVYHHMCCGFPSSRRGTLPHRCLCPPRVKIHQANFGCEDGNEVLCPQDGDPKNLHNKKSIEFAESKKAYRNSTRIFFSPAIPLTEYEYSLSEIDTVETKAKIAEFVKKAKNEACQEIDHGPRRKEFCNIN